MLTKCQQNKNTPLKAIIFLAYNDVTLKKGVMFIMNRNFFCRKGDEKSPNAKMRYVGVFSEAGKEVSVKDSFYYALWRVLSSEEEMKEFTEWYYSGNWILKEVEHEEEI